MNLSELGDKALFRNAVTAGRDRSGVVSAIELLVFGDIRIWRDVKSGALRCQDASLEGEVVAESVSNEIHRVEVPSLEVHVVHIVAAGGIDNSADLRPDRRHATHSAGLQRRVERSTAEFRCVQLLAG